jgi:hypothetical protein
MNPQIKKMMAARKRELATVKRSFPKYKPGDTVARYIAQYAVLNGPGAHVLPFDFGAYARPATLPEGPEVVEETEQ